MIMRSIRVGRTYNTDNYTSQRYDIEAELRDGDDPEGCMVRLAETLHAISLLAMTELGVKRVIEPTGTISLPRPQVAIGDADVDEIPW